LDRPPFKVLSDRVLVALSHSAPRSFAELGRIKGLPHRLPSRERRTLLDVVDRGLHAPVPTKPARSRSGHDEDARIRYEALREWRKTRAEARGVEPDVILSNRTLHVLADQNPSSPEQVDRVHALNDWERREYGREIVALLRRRARIRTY
jgi:ribonuclease D